MKWIKTWAMIDNKTVYLVLAAISPRGGGAVYFSHPQILPGWQVKSLLEGSYVAGKLTKPASLKECE